MSCEQNKQVARDFFGALGRRESEAMNALMHDDLQWWVIGEDGFGGTKDKAELNAAIGALWDMMEGDCTIDFVQMTAEDDRVAIIGQGEMATKGGVPYRNTYNFLLTIRDAKVFRGREYFDTKMVDRVFGF